jgi:hypothetical protein
MADPPWAPVSDSLTSPILLNERDGGESKVRTICPPQAFVAFDSVS